MVKPFVQTFNIEFLNKINRFEMKKSVGHRARLDTTAILDGNLRNCGVLLQKLWIFRMYIEKYKEDVMYNAQTCNITTLLHKRLET